MVGDTTNGIWNESEGISLIFKVRRSLVLPASLALTRDASRPLRYFLLPQIKFKKNVCKVSDASRVSP
jgi:hypothetical protein